MISEEGKIRISEGRRKGNITRSKQRQGRVNNFGKKCKECGVQIPYDKRRNDYCSRSCGASQNNRKYPKRTQEGSCVNCNEVIASDRTYCTNCWANNKGLRSYIVKTSHKLLPDACMVCEKPLPRQHIAYCSAECRKHLEDYITRSEVEAGNIKTPQTIRKFLLRTQPNECAICKTSQWQGQPTPLVMDHIDGSSDNNKLSNLRLICPNCDAQTSTYKSKNKGNGRHSRRLRYAEGKSY